MILSLPQTLFRRPRSAGRAARQPTNFGACHWSLSFGPLKGLFVCVRKARHRKFASGFAQPVPLVEVNLRDFPVPDKQPVIHLCTDAGRCPVGATGPRDQRLPLLVQAHEELVVPERAGRDEAIVASSPVPG